MADIPFETAHFPAVVPPVGSLRASRARLNHAAITVGIAPAGAMAVPPSPLLRGAPARIYVHRAHAERVWRTAIAHANLAAAGSFLVRSPSYKRLDPSEKSAVSYFLGMLQAKLAAEQVLGISHLVHLDSLPALRTSKSRPDFYGIDSRFPSTCYFVEAKGRSGGYAPDVVAKAKAQVKKMPRHRSFTATVDIATLAYFDTNHRWNAYLEDPVTEHVESVYAPDEGDLYFAYYAPIVAAMSRDDEQFEEGDVTTTIAPDGAQISCPRRIFQSIRSILNGESKSRDKQNEELADVVRNALRDRSANEETDSAFVGLDGIGIILRNQPERAR